MAIIGGLFGLLGGGFCLLGAILNWDWFFRARKSAIIDKLFGRTGARIFYAILGVILVVGGIWFAIYSLISAA